MLASIRIGSCVTVQGQIVKSLKDGRLAVRVGEKVFLGWPVAKAA